MEISPILGASTSMRNWGFRRSDLSSLMKRLSNGNNLPVEASHGLQPFLVHGEVNTTECDNREDRHYVCKFETWQETD